jgi:hypothetical protein
MVSVLLREAGRLGKRMEDGTMKMEIGFILIAAE